MVAAGPMPRSVAYSVAKGDASDPKRPQGPGGRAVELRAARGGGWSLCSFPLRAGESAGSSRSMPCRSRSARWSRPSGWCSIRRSGAAVSTGFGRRCWRSWWDCPRSWHCRRRSSSRGGHRRARRAPAPSQGSELVQSTFATRASPRGHPADLGPERATPGGAGCPCILLQKVEWSATSGIGSTLTYWRGAPNWQSRRTAARHSAVVASAASLLPGNPHPGRINLKVDIGTLLIASLLGKILWR